MQEKTKVIAYIIKGTGENREVLVFEHRDLPQAGIQIPGGTVDSTETLKKALFREVFEETGLAINEEVDLFKYLGMFHYQRQDLDELNKRHLFQIEFAKELPLEWEHLVTGDGEDCKMVFKFYWMPVSEAKKVLTGQFGEYFALLR